MVLFKKIAASGKYHDPQAIPDVISYITKPNKTPSALILGANVDMQNIASSMIAVSELFNKNSRLRLHHFILSFESKDAAVLPQIAQAICAYIGKIYQIVAALHEDTQYPHIHVVFNAVSFVNGYKYRGGKSEYKKLINDLKVILYPYDLLPLIPVNYYPCSEHPHE